MVIVAGSGTRLSWVSRLKLRFAPVVVMVTTSVSEKGVVPPPALVEERANGVLLAVKLPRRVPVPKATFVVSM